MGIIIFQPIRHARMITLAGYWLYQLLNFMGPCSMAGKVYIAIS